MARINKMKRDSCGLAEIRDVSNDGKIADHVLIHEEVTSCQEVEKKEVRWRASSWFQWLINRESQRMSETGSAEFSTGILEGRKGMQNVGAELNSNLVRRLRTPPT